MINIWAIEKTLDDANVKYIKNEDDKQSIITVRYRGIIDKNIVINIYIYVDEQTEQIVYTLLENLNTENNNDTKGMLLDFNSHLNYGIISMKEDSNKVEYRLESSAEKFDFEIHNTNVIRCITVYEKLKEKEVI